MKKLIALLIILTLVLSTIPIYAEPSKSGYEKSDYEDIFQGKSPIGSIYSDYLDHELKDTNDYFISITKDKEFVEGSPGSFKFTPMQEAFLPTANFKVEVIRDGKVIKTATTHDNGIGNIGEFEIGDKLKITDMSKAGGKGAIGKNDLQIILQEPGLEYKTSPGSYNTLTPGGTIEFKINKKGKYLLAMQTMLKEYAAYNKNHTVTYEIWSANGAHHAWGENIYGGEPWAGWSHFTGLTLSAIENLKPPIVKADCRGPVVINRKTGGTWQPVAYIMNQNNVDVYVEYELYKNIDVPKKADIKNPKSIPKGVLAKKSSVVIRANGSATVGFSHHFPKDTPYGKLIKFTAIAKQRRTSTSPIESIKKAEGYCITCTVPEEETRQDPGGLRPSVIIDSEKGHADH